MKRAAFTLIVGVVFAGAALPDDLPPGVVLLASVKRHMREELDRLPNVSCLETLRREYQPAKGKMKPLDTVRLEVHTDGGKEFFASPGGREFSTGNPVDYVGSGVIGNGFFGIHLKNILENRNVSFAYKGEEEIAGRRLARFDYMVSKAWGGQFFTLPEGSGTAGMHGSLWVDPATHDVVQLETSADDFPPTLPLEEAVTRIVYARTALEGGAAALLPVSGEFRMVKLSGETSHNEIEFSGCRLFRAKSEISFDAPDSGGAAPLSAVAPSIPETERTLPGGLRVEVQLRSRISGNLAVGASIEGVVAAEVRQNGQVAIAAGSPVHGRIRRLECHAEPEPYFAVGLEYTEVESRGIRHRFLADLLELGSAPGVEAVLSSASSKSEPLAGGRGGSIEKRKWDTTWLPDLPGAAVFFVRGNELDPRPGFRTVWMTRTAAP